MILGILQNRLIDGKRGLIFKEYKKAMRDYSAGEVKTGWLANKSPGLVFSAYRSATIHAMGFS
jgi:hypothetical protein